MQGKPRCKMVMDAFAARQFDKTKAGLSFINFDTQAFGEKIQEAYDNDETVTLQDGYAPFCKHLFVKNFTETISLQMKITPENTQFLKSGYVARRENELGVLSRWFNAADLPGKFEPAQYLDIILYSKEQIGKENESMGEKNVNADVDYDYGIISIKSQDVGHELPMQPITAMRNSLDKKYGGSGVPIDEVYYKKCVEFW